jgi:hypothetical protein
MVPAQGATFITVMSVLGKTAPTSHHLERSSWLTVDSWHLTRRRGSHHGVAEEGAEAKGQARGMHAARPPTAYELVLTADRKCSSREWPRQALLSASFRTPAQYLRDSRHQQGTRCTFRAGINGCEWVRLQWIHVYWADRHSDELQHRMQRAGACFRHQHQGPHHASVAGLSETTRAGGSGFGLLPRF